jgi:plasmid stabilization system protein ParE
MSIVWTERAELDLQAICDYIARDNPIAAARWVTRLVSAVERLGAMPRSGSRVPELGRDEIREIIMGGYRIVYRVSSTRVAVLTLFEGHRLLAVDLDEDA